MSSVPVFEQRRCERFRLEPMYTSVCLQEVAESGPPRDGHAYDISESGVRLEIDEPPAVGAFVQVDLNLPADPQPIAASGRVVWTNDEDDDPAARRMAVRFESFATDSDRVRLNRFLGDSGRRQ
ncbi:MAG: hypothetical protein HKO59_09865 [Phycisphaerales bacterium]|nr:PilZ domain-containing protein [Phycisphaerae bacterium]NNF44391.1 hypothetical protein [Phycisphaerales bacterium]NNM26269.1 hypothetical protein [Phycisphaerales bacterium]